MNSAIGSLVPGRIDQQALARKIQAMFARRRPEVAAERRLEDRVSMPLLFILTPLNSAREPIHDDALTVVGKDISRRGLSFFHERPLTYRRAIVSLEHPDFGHFAAEIDINRCRFTKPGWYESSGRLMGLVERDCRPANTVPEPANGSQLTSVTSDTRG